MIGPVARGKPISIELLVNAEVPGMKLLFIACVVETDLLGIITNFKGPRFILSFQDKKEIGQIMCETMDCIGYCSSIFSGTFD